jgi:hypothetical protein
MTSNENEVLTDHSENGVDLTLIRWILWLTPPERCSLWMSTLPPQTEAQKLAIIRRTLEEPKNGPIWPHTPQQ